MLTKAEMLLVFVLREKNNLRGRNPTASKEPKFLNMVLVDVKVP